MIDAGLISETRGLDRLKLLARDDQARALPEVVREFEAEFLRMMLKSMREAKLAEDPLENDAARMYRDMYDAEIARAMARGPGLGLRDALLRQLSPPAAPAAALTPPSAPSVASTPPVASAAVPTPFRPSQAWPVAASDPPQDAAPVHASAAHTTAPGDAGAARADFVRRVWPHAEAASRASGVPARYIVAHAALESGWGRHEPRAENGLPSHNLFGIKAGRGWDGAVAESATNEFAAGRWQRGVERFRAYASYADGLTDYARLLRQRYGIRPDIENGMSEAQFAQRLADGGYATDPAYADKLTRVLGSDVFRTALAASG